MHHDTNADRNEPLAIKHRDLNDRQLESMFERVCDDTKVGRWVCGSKHHFDVTSDDLREEINLLINAVDPDIRGELELDHILRIIAWRWELSCLTNGSLEV
jgi:hypothetical protein